MLVDLSQSIRKAPLLLLFGILATSHGVEAAPSDRAVPARVLQRWTVDDGLPINSVTGIVQDDEGFIWLSTLGGLVRFDGLHFTTFDSHTFRDLPSDRLTALHRTPDGVLWLTTEQNDLVSFDGERFRPLDVQPPFANEDVVRTAVRPDGWLAFGTRRGVGIVGPEGVSRLLPNEITGVTEALLWSRSGRLWTVSDGVLRRVDEPLAASPKVTGRWDVGAETLVLEEDRGTVWIGTKEGLFKVANDVLVRGPPELPRTPVIRLEHTNGILHVDTGDIWSVEGGRAVLQGSNEGSSWRDRIVIPFSSGDYGISVGRTLLTPRGDQIELPAPVRAAVVDHEGNTWLAPNGEGLMLWRDASLHALGSSEGLAGDRAYPVLEASDGSIWVGILGHGAARIPPEGGEISTFRDIDPVWSIAEVDGEIWLAGGGLCRIEGSRCVRVASPDFEEFRMLYQTRSGRVLLAGSLGTLFERVEKSWRRFDERISGWPAKQPIRALVEDEGSGLWLGTNGSGIVYLRGSEAELIDTSSGLSSDLVRALYLDGRGNLLIGTENRGLCRLRLTDRDIDCIDKRQRLYSSGIHHIEGDDRGRLWMSSNQGIFWLDLDELLEVLDGSKPFLTVGGSFNGRNGMRSSEANGGVFPAGLKDRSGKLWWPTQGGLVVIDPESELFRIPPVSSRIGKVLSRGEELVQRGDRLDLPPGVRTLQLELEAPSYFDPSAIEFRLRIPETGEDWIELGRSRNAGPIAVPRGEVTIETAARNPGGTWQQTPTRMHLFVPALWHERTSVRASLTLAVLLLVGLAVWSREMRSRKYALALEGEVAERTAEVRKQQQQIAELSQRRTDMYTNIAHELRTPLTLILGPLEEMHESGGAPDSKAIGTMARSARRMKRLVNQILDLERLDARELRIEAEEIELVSFVTMVSAPFLLLAEQSGIPFRIRSDLSSVMVDGDREQLEKILGNLLSNAFKFSPAGSEVELLIRAAGDNVAIVVSDSGCGIPEESLERIFERFYQVESGLTRATEGSGIGLSLARELARLHGGDVDAENREEGGARLILRLPCKEPETALRSREPSRTEPMSANTMVDDGNGSRPARRTILVVEDDAELREYIGSCVRDLYETLHASDGKEGLALARARLPDLVVSDVMMPGGDGLEMLRELRSDPETRSIPIILLTAGGKATELEGLQSGADDYIAKPFNRQSLRARIAARLSVGQRLAEALGREREIASETSRTDDEEIAERAGRIVREHMAEPEFGVHELASALFMSRSSLHRWMVGTLDMTPGAFIRDLRLRVAANLLREGFSASEVGIATGFSSLASFSHSFKAAYGVSPSLYAPSR